MAISPPDSLGRDLRVLRKQRGLTLTEVSEMVGRSVGWLSQVERDISMPSPEELERLASALDVSLKTFFGRAPSRPGEEDRIVRKNARRPVERRVDGLVEELLSPELGVGHGEHHALPDGRVFRQDAIHLYIANLTIATTTTFVDWPSVTQLGDGNLVVTWTDNYSTGLPTSDVKLQILDDPCYVRILRLVHAGN